MDIAIVYSDDYDVSLGGLEKLHPFDIHKYRKIHRGLLKQGLIQPSDAFTPQPVSREQLEFVHSRSYLQQLENPTRVAQFLELPMLANIFGGLVSKRIRKGMQHCTGGTIKATELALTVGAAINIGGGYHHAKPYVGEGFCLYADVAVAIALQKQIQPELKTLIVDLDAHQGNGNIVCFSDDPSVFTFSMHQSNIYPMPKEQGSLDIGLAAGTDDQDYLSQLKTGLTDAIEQAQADLVFYIAGSDILHDDPLTDLGVTPEGLIERDQLVFKACHDKGLPIVMTLSGGYGKSSASSHLQSISRLISNYGLARYSPSLKKRM